MGKYFTINELAKSDTANAKGINNTPCKCAESNLNALIDNVLDVLREAYGKPIKVNSGYRCEALNKAVRGAKNSQHLVGEAVDITGGSKAENKRIFELAKTMNLPFDQLIDERDYSWIHISYKQNGKNRLQVLHL